LYLIRHSFLAVLHCQPAETELAEKRNGSSEKMQTMVGL
jgi:hypothetical protein